jgi:hypothetical protein
MNVRRLGIGLVLLVGGVVLAWFAHRHLAYYREGLGSITKRFSEDESSRSAAWEAARLGGGIVAAIGALLAVASLAKGSSGGR